MPSKNSHNSIKTSTNTISVNKWKDPSNWPAALHDFVNKCFAEANKKNYSSKQNTIFRNQMKDIINLAIKEDKVLTNDWTKQTIPFLIDSKKAKLALHCDLNSSEKDTEEPAEVKKRNIFGEVESDDNDSNGLEVSKPTKSISISETIGRLKKQKVTTQPLKFTQKKVENMSNKRKLEERSKRFERELSISTSISLSDDSISTEPIVGKNQTLEKKYLRLTSQPRPETVRPLHILKQTLQLLFDKFFEGASYHYMCDQCKSLRQDLTVQNIKNDFTIMAYEFHSKLAILNGDWGEFNQCQSQLKILYDRDDLEKPNRLEFLSYRILYYIFTDNGNEIHELEAHLMEENGHYAENEFLSKALQISVAIFTSDFYQLSTIVNELMSENNEKESLILSRGENENRLLITDTKALLLKHGPFFFFTKFLVSIMERENIRTLASLCNGFKQLPVNFLTEILCLKTDENLFEFLSQKQLMSFVNEEKTAFNAQQARSRVDQLKSSAFRKIDIKGQV
ncbi:hypothetical protein CANINC_004423 [Pichia inconspicua]|uniref:SAC3/GANP/THP3 conserved domain-containing protein n=1 Tax=Pichia inconspicua TaxID=52247 RepID=A0A4T0WW86_9ASCO|nr:hypothetical protein CANINC_004423 [[Candida] inconspicua]